ncbi:MAG TPA: hypothetical protein VLH79_13355, partial [Chthonomonadales bacterium]|nr:hypothetical protein [Chthonomonadales bacterium]
LSGVVGTPTRGQNHDKAGGDGWFDLIIDFPRGQPKRLVSGQTSVYKLTGTGLNVAYLKDRWSSPRKGLDQTGPRGEHGPFLAAAHIQGIGLNNGLSAWVYATREPPPSVSEAGALQFAVFAGLGALALMRRRRA